LPLGEPIENTNQPQRLARVRIYPGANGDFSLYQDDGSTYAYESGDHTITNLHWDDTSSKFSYTGPRAWTVSDRELAEIIGK
jgi:alpha-D-xyloside xylohydrolase